MGSALYIELEREIEGVDPHIDGKMFARAEGYLSAIAEDLGVIPPIKFVIVPAEQLAEFLIEQDLADLAADASKIDAVWFEAKDGLKSLCALCGNLEEDPKAFSDFSSLETNSVLMDLRDAVAVLERADRADVRWRLVVDY